MKAKLEFDLDDYEDKVNFEHCLNAGEYLTVLRELDESLRRKTKYGEDKAEYDHEYFRDMLHELLNEQDVAIWS